MDIQVNFLSDPQCVKTYWDRTETEFRIKQLGFHDFSSHKIKPQTFLHQQDFYTLHLILSGKGQLNFNEKTYQLSGGDIFVLPPDQFFSYYPSSDAPWSYIFFVLEGSKVKEYMESVGFQYKKPIKHCPESKKLLPAFLEFFEKHKNGLPVSYFECVSLLFQLLNMTTDNNSPLLSHQQTDIVKEVKVFIELNYLDPNFSVNDITEALHVSHTWLCRLFRLKTGMTMISYINDARMKYAEALLRKTNLKATKIASMSGFNEYSYFLLQFKKRNHMTTVEYRNSHKTI